jgi:tRNA A-37 threonylcarbamoyl transferase component Bud32
MTRTSSVTIESAGRDHAHEPEPALLSAEEFARYGRHLDAPFRLRLVRRDGSIEVRCVELYRVLPGKRVVVRATLDERNVVLKLFLGSRAPRYRQREARGIAAIARCGVRVPALIDGGRLEAGAGEWLAFEFVANARALSEDDLADAGSRDAVLRALAQLHEGGVVQEDLHLGNFLVTSQRALYAIDGDAVRADTNGALSRRRSIENLALFLAQFPPREDHRVAHACETYAAERGWPRERLDHRHLATRVAQARELRVRRYLRKALRDCTEFHAEASASQFVVADRAALADDGLAAVLRDLSGAVDAAPKLKAGRSATVAEVSTESHPFGGPFVIKRYNIKSPSHALSRLFRPSRAYHAWRNAQRLRFLGISDARPRALVEHRVLRWLRRDAYLVMAKVDGIDLMRHATLEAGCSEPIVAAVVRLFSDLKELRLVHGDTKATNFIVTQHGVVLIDLDSMRRIGNRTRFTTLFDADLERFLENFSAFPNVQERFRSALAPLR